MLCEYPGEASSLAPELTFETLSVDGDGVVNVPERPGLVLTLNPATIRRYLQSVEISIGEKVVFMAPKTPMLNSLALVFSVFGGSRRPRRLTYLQYSNEAVAILYAEHYSLNYVESR